jgi:hypothetical protein
VRGFWVWEETKSNQGQVLLLLSTAHTLLLTLLGSAWSYCKQTLRWLTCTRPACRLLQICHGYGQVQFPYSVSEDDPTPMREWVPVAGTQQDEAALLNQGVRPDSIRGYVEPQEDLLKAPWERSMVLRPHCTNPNLRMRVSQGLARSWLG